jgi:hypothetical protein
MGGREELWIAGFADVLPADIETPAGDVGTVLFREVDGVVPFECDNGGAAKAPFSLAVVDETATGGRSPDTASGPVEDGRALAIGIAAAGRAVSPTGEAGESAGAEWLRVGNDTVVCGFPIIPVRAFEVVPVDVEVERWNEDPENERKFDELIAPMADGVAGFRDFDCETTVCAGLTVWILSCASGG